MKKTEKNKKTRILSVYTGDSIYGISRIFYVYINVPKPLILFLLRRIYILNVNDNNM